MRIKIEPRKSFWKKRIVKVIKLDKGITIIRPIGVMDNKRKKGQQA